MSTLKERLEEVMADQEWDQADLKRVSGESSSVVSQWLGKGSKEIKTIGKLEAAQRIEAASGFAALWVAKGMGEKRITPKRGVAHDLSDLAPIVNPQQVDWGVVVSGSVPPVFALVVKDDAMSPLLSSGDIARFSRTAAPKPGRPVLVKDGSGGVYIRDYQPRSSSAWVATARNAAYLPLDSNQDQLEIIATMTGLDWADGGKQ